MFLTANQIKNRRIVVSLYLPFALFVQIFLFPTISDAERLPIKTYIVADGLLRDNVTRIRQDSRGFLWFCTSEGISRFDGYGFTNFTTQDGLPDRHVYDFLETRSGTILLATGGGLAKLNPKGIRGEKENPLFTVSLPEDLKTNGIGILFEDKDGAVLIGTNGGLYRVRETNGNFEFEKIKPEAGILHVSAIIQDRRGVLWVGTSGEGLFRLLPSGESEHYTTASGLPNNAVESLLETADGQIWMGMRDQSGGLVRLASEQPAPNRPIVERIYTMKDGLPWNWIPALFESSNGKFWVATTSGLCLWQGEGGDSVCRNYTAKNDLCDKDVWSIAEDKDENLWVGSRCGLKKIGRYGFTTYTEADGLNNSQNHSIFQNRKGDFFVHSLSNGLTVSRFDAGKFLTVKPNLPRVKDFGWGWKQTVWQDSAGAWWIPTGEGLFRFSDVKNFSDLSQALPEEIKTGVNEKNVFRLFEDSRGDIWAVLRGGKLLRWERVKNTWHNYTETLGMFEKNIGVMAFVEDRNGNLWIATGGSMSESVLIRYRDGNFKIFDQTDGVPIGWVRDLLIDRAGRLWIANTVEGLFRLDDPNSEKLNFVRYTIADGLSSNGIYCLTEDEFGRIYVGTGRGLDRLTPETGQIENFTTADGLPNSDVQVAYRDRTNALWFATTDGLARFQPKPVRPRKPPTVLIMGLRVGGESQSVSILGETEIFELDLTADQNQVSIDFIGLGATLGEKLRYEYRMSGGEWIRTSEHTVNFANLASGSYRFELRAISADRNPSQSAFVSFRIAAPLWQRGWFITLLSLLIALIIYLIYRNRLAQILTMERMRTRIATDLHDDIGANLTRISLLSEVARQANGKSSKMFSSIADIARESVSSMDDIVWAISPEHDSLLDLTRRMRQHAEEVFVFRDIELQFNAPSSDTDLKLSVSVRRDLLLIFKETVNNAARHSDCSQVAIDFRREHSVLTLSIKDNGKGFEIGKETEGNGLPSITRRAQTLGGKIKIDSRKGAGTTVLFELPLPKTIRG